MHVNVSGFCKALILALCLGFVAFGVSNVGAAKWKSSGGPAEAAQGERAPAAAGGGEKCCGGGASEASGKQQRMKRHMRKMGHMQKMEDRLAGIENRLSSIESKLEQLLQRE